MNDRAGMIATLRQRNFALLWTAGLISLIGDWAFYAAMPIFILDRTGSAFQSGLVWAAIALRQASSCRASLYTGMTILTANFLFIIVLPLYAQSHPTVHAEIEKQPCF